MVNLSIVLTIYESRALFRTCKKLLDKSDLCMSNNFLLIQQRVLPFIYIFMMYRYLDLFITSYTSDHNHSKSDVLSDVLAILKVTYAILLHLFYGYLDLNFHFFNFRTNSIWFFSFLVFSEQSAMIYGISA